MMILFTHSGIYTQLEKDRSTAKDRIKQEKGLRGTMSERRSEYEEPACD